MNNGVGTQHLQPVRVVKFRHVEKAEIALYPIFIEELEPLDVGCLEFEILTDFEYILVGCLGFKIADEVQELVIHQGSVNKVTPNARQLTLDFPDLVMPITLLQAVYVRILRLMITFVELTR